MSERASPPYWSYSNQQPSYGSLVPRINELENVIVRSDQEHDQELEALGASISQVEQQMDSEALQLEGLNAEQSGEVRRLEDIVATKIEEMKQGRKQSQLEIFDSIDHKCQPFADDVVAYRKQWQTQEERYNAVVRQEADNLASLVQSQRQHRCFPIAVPTRLVIGGSTGTLSQKVSSEE